MAALATLTDLGVRLGVSLTDNARAQAALDDASAAVREYTGQTFTSSAKTATLTPCCGAVTLPDGPVTAVASIVDADNNPVTFTWTNGRKIKVSGIYGPVTVAYTSGWTTIPPIVVAVVCQIAGRAYGTTADQGGTTQESLGGYSHTTGTIAAAGAVGLLPAEMANLDRFRRRVGTHETPSWLTAAPVVPW